MKQKEASWDCNTDDECAKCGEREACSAYCVRKEDEVRKEDARTAPFIGIFIFAVAALFVIGACAVCTDPSFQFPAPLFHP